MNQDIRAAYAAHRTENRAMIDEHIWVLGRIAGIRESAIRALTYHTDMEDNWRAIVLQRESTVNDLRAHARKLKARIK